MYPQCRLIRRPVYIRGKNSICGARGLTLGYACRFDLDGVKKSLYIGDNCQFGDNTHIVALEKVEIGNNVLLASNVFVSDTNHGIYRGEIQSSPEQEPNNRKLYSKQVKIGDNVWVGQNVVILAGSNIGTGCIIGANAVVSKSIPDYSMVVGKDKIIKVFDFSKKCWIKCEEEN